MAENSITDSSEASIDWGAPEPDVVVAIGRGKRFTYEIRRGALSVYQWTLRVLVDGELASRCDIVGSPRQCFMHFADARAAAARVERADL